MHHQHERAKPMSTANPRLLLALLACAAGASACFRLDPDDGRYACNPTPCPSGLVCGSDNRCWHTLPVHDMAMPSLGTVSIVTPKATAYTNATIGITVAVNGNSIAKVELLVDGSVLATLPAPYVYNWETTQVAEGAHQVVARATFASRTVDSDARTIVVDRTPPTVMAQTPAPGAANVSVHAPITVQFSEAIAPETVDDQSVTLSAGLNKTLPKTLALSADGTTLSLAPTSLSSLALPALVSGGVNSGIKDLAGNPLQPAAWSWNVPSGIVIGTPFPAQPPNNGAVVIDKTGNPVDA
jgi:hypothetical protein